MDTALISVAAGAVSGASAGFVAAWFRRPIAEVRAENTRLRNEQRRKLVGDARAAMEDAGRGGWGSGRFAHDRRFQAIKRFLPEEVKRFYVAHSGEDDYTAVEMFEELAQAVDALETRWDLI